MNDFDYNFQNLTRDWRMKTNNVYIIRKIS
jgi:hypothetical protein